MIVPSFSSINVQYVTYLSFDVYWKQNNSKLATLTRNYKRFYDISFTSVSQRNIISSVPSLCKDVFVVQDWLNSSDSDSSY